MIKTGDKIKTKKEEEIVEEIQEDTDGRFLIVCKSKDKKFTIKEGDEDYTTED